VRLATFNISSGRQPDADFDLDRYASAIAALDADVLALQEVDRGQPRSAGADLTAVAADALGAPYRLFAPALYGTPGGAWTPATGPARDGPAYGCALISRYPWRDLQVLHMPAVPLALPLWVPGHGVVIAREEPRVAIAARIDRPDAPALTVIATHLPFVPGWKGRQLRRLAKRVETRPNPLVLMGDLNLRGRTPSRITGFRSLVQLASYPSSRPLVQLDHVLLRGSPDLLGRVTATRAPASTISDHRPVMVDVIPVAGE